MKPSNPAIDSTVAGDNKAFELYFAALGITK